VLHQFRLQHIKIKEAWIGDVLEQVVQGGLLVKSVQDLHSWGIRRHVNGAVFFSLLDCISVHYRLLHISKRNFLALDKDWCELSPLSLVKFFAFLVLWSDKNFFGEVHNQIDDTRCNFDVYSSLSHLGVLVNDFVFVFLTLYHQFSVGFSRLGLKFRCHLHFSVLSFSFFLFHHSLLSALVKEHLFAFA